MRTTVDEDDKLAKESHLGHILGVQTALTVVSVIVVCLRVYVRTMLVRSPGSDDWTMVVAAVSVHPFFSPCFLRNKCSIPGKCTIDQLW